jgi:hypothetical protein
VEKAMENLTEQNNEEYYSWEEEIGFIDGMIAGLTRGNVDKKVIDETKKELMQNAVNDYPRRKRSIEERTHEIIEDYVAIGYSREEAEEKSNFSKIIMYRIEDSKEFYKNNVPLDLPSAVMGYTWFDETHRQSLLNNPRARQGLASLAAASHEGLLDGKPPSGEDLLAIYKKNIEMCLENCEIPEERRRILRHTERASDFELQYILENKMRLAIKHNLVGYFEGIFDLKVRCKVPAYLKHYPEFATLSEEVFTDYVDKSKEPSLSDYLLGVYETFRSRLGSMIGLESKTNGN